MGAQGDTFVKVEWDTGGVWMDPESYPKGALEFVRDLVHDMDKPSGRVDKLSIGQGVLRLGLRVELVPEAEF